MFEHLFYFKASFKIFDTMFSSVESNLCLIVCPRKKFLKKKNKKTATQISIFDGSTVKPLSFNLEYTFDKVETWLS